MTAAVKAARRLFRRRAALRDAYVRVFASADGQRVLHDILARNGMMQSSFEPGDPHATSFNEGRRRAALEILDQLSWTEGELRQLGERFTAEKLSAAAETSEIGDDA